MAPFAYIFPGQGSQYVGMGRDICDNFKAARLVFEEAEDEIHLNLRKLAFEGPEDELSKTENTQPAILVLSAAILAALREAGVGSGGDRPIFSAGHSLGEYTALVAAEAVALRAAAGLVRKRGRFMQSAVPEERGAMAAVIGMEPERLDALLKEASTDDEVVVAANYNAPGQVVVSGHREAVMRVHERAKDAGALKVILLKVSVPSHSPLMASAAESLAKELAGIAFANPAIPVVSNVTAAPYGGPDSIGELLTRQLVSPVRWEESIKHMIDQGVTEFIEVGPGKVLAGLNRRIDPKAAVMSIGDVVSVSEAEKKFH
jgi:[acyl-carrier-protein] S-malonyltransferase